MRKIFVFCVFCAAISLIGCAKQQTGSEIIELDKSPDAWERAYKDEGTIYLDGSVAARPPGQVAKQPSRVEYTDREKSLAEYFESFNDIENVSVTINGDAAVISLCLQGEPDSARIVSIKHAVRRHALDFDKDLENVTVNCTPELFNRVTDSITRSGRKKKSSIPPEKTRLFPIIPTF